MSQQEQELEFTQEQEAEIQTRKDIEARIIAKAWKDEAYKRELFANPKAVIGQEFGVEFAEEVTIQVTEENPTSLYLVLPMLPEIEEVEFSEEELEILAGGRRTLESRLNRLGGRQGPMNFVKRKSGAQWTPDIGKDSVKVAGATVTIALSVRFG